MNLKKKSSKREVWLVVDRATWHSTKGLKLPDNLKIKTLPTAAAQINPIERLWLYIRKYFTNGKVHKSLDCLESTLSQALQHLHKMPEKLMSICKDYNFKNKD